MPNFNPPSAPCPIYSNEVDSNIVLLLPFNGDDGDTSTTDQAEGGSAPHTATFNGDAQIDTAQFKYGGSSLLLDGAGDYLDTSSGSDFAFGTGDFTIEMWFRPSAIDQRYLFDFRDDGNTDEMAVYLQGDGNVRFYANSGTRIDAGSSSVGTGGTWYHLAIVRFNGTTKMYLNGVNVGSSYSDSTDYDSTVLQIGARYSDAEYFSGNIDDLMVTNGEARYIDDFTPPPPHSSRKNSIDHSAVLIANMDGRNKQTWYTPDSRGINTYEHDVTFNGTAEILKSNSGQGMGYFAASADSWYAVDSANWQPKVGWKTLEFWFNTAQATGYITGQSASSGANNTQSFHVVLSSGVLYFRIAVGSDIASQEVSGGSGLNDSKWHHVACVIDGSDIQRLYIDGVEVGTPVDLSAKTPNDVSYAMAVGRLGEYTSTGFIGYISAVKMSSTYEYTGSFTPPTEFVRDANTLLHLDFEGMMHSTVLVDKSDSAHAFTAAGTAKIISSNKWPVPPAGLDTGMVKLDGSGDYLSIPDSDDWDFGTGDFTVEFWFRRNGAPAAAEGFVGAFETPGQTGWVCDIEGGTRHVRFNITGAVGLTSDTNYTDNAWTHYAISREGTNLRLFQNGTLVDSTTDSTDITGAGTLVVGRFYNNFDDYYFNGHITGLRVENGTALYTAAFNPWDDAVALTAGANTVLLLNFIDGHGSTTITDSSGSAHTVTANGDAVTITPTDAGGVLFLDGNSDYWSIPDSDDWDFGASPFSIGAWIFQDIANDDNYRGVLGSADFSSSGWCISRYASSHPSTPNALNYSDGYSAGSTNSDVMATSEWIYVEVCYDGTNVYLFVNGVLKDTVAFASVNSGGDGLRVGQRGATDANAPWSGYQDGVFVKKGVCLHTSDFTPPAESFSPYQDVVSA